jgi:hypothetical protein
MHKYSMAVIDGTLNQAGSDWPHMSQTICAPTADDAINSIEDEIDLHHWPRAADYGVTPGSIIVVTIVATDASGQAVSRTVRYGAT